VSHRIPVTLCQGLHFSEDSGDCDSLNQTQQCREVTTAANGFDDAVWRMWTKKTSGSVWWRDLPNLDTYYLPFDKSDRLVGLSQRLPDKMLIAGFQSDFYIVFETARLVRGEASRWKAEEHAFHITAQHHFHFRRISQWQTTGCRVTWWQMLCTCWGAADANSDIFIHILPNHIKLHHLHLDKLWWLVVICDEPLRDMNIYYSMHFHAILLVF